ncbi:hypothetical protein BJ166DRAFT_585796 [Pestalotiopsis sp. NC0098]|nr:hypothetical protein BJ166DRAFT_585796 [Pestalotiopsis sp. NC0098]
MPPSMSSETIDRGPQGAVASTPENLSSRLKTASMNSPNSPVPSSFEDHPSSPKYISGGVHELGHDFNGQELQEQGDMLHSGGQTSSVDDESDRPIQYSPIRLNWTVRGYESSVHWNRQPSIPSIISVLEQVLGSDEILHIEPTWDGLYNKFYTVHCQEDTKYVMKLTLPVCPRTKTESEVATIRWTVANTNLWGAMPEVVAYSSSPDNPTGCEWMLMEHLPGKRLSECWKDITLEAKERIVLVLAKYAQCVFETQFKQIGSLYPAPLPSRGKRYQVGKICSRRFFWEEGTRIEPNQGPFSSIKEWWQRRMNLANEHVWLRFDSIMHGRDDTERQRIWRLINMSGVESRLWQLHEHLFPAKEKHDDEGGHTIEAIGRPMLVDDAMSLGSDQASELSSQDDLEDGEIREEDDEEEATLCNPLRLGAYGFGPDSTIEPSTDRHVFHRALEHRTPEPQSPTPSHASSTSTLTG